MRGDLRDSRLFAESCECSQVGLVREHFAGLALGDERGFGLSSFGLQLLEELGGPDQDLASFPVDGVPSEGLDF